MTGRAKHWTFTVNNWTDAEHTQILGLYPSIASYMVVGKEVGEAGTPHLQGFISFKSVTRFNQVKNLIGNRAFLEIARQPKNAAEYCKKEGNFEERGEPAAQQQGQRNDLEDFKKAVIDGEYDMKKLRMEHSEVVAKYPQFCALFVMDNTPLPEIELHPLREWQQTLNARLNGPADDRKIIFIVDTTGNSGKSWFGKYYEHNHPDEVQIMDPGKRTDMAYMLNPAAKVLIMDAPRSRQNEYLQYDFLEQVKNGIVSSYKYVCIQKRIPHKMHVVVMMNQEPDMDKLSADRYDIINV